MSAGRTPVLRPRWTWSRSGGGGPGRRGTHRRPRPGTAGRGDRCSPRGRPRNPSTRRSPGSPSGMRSSSTECGGSRSTSTSIFPRSTRKSYRRVLERQLIATSGSTGLAPRSEHRRARTGGRVRRRDRRGRRHRPAAPRDRPQRPSRVNEPGTPFDARTRRVELTESTRAANARFFGLDEPVPRFAVTQGLGTIAAHGVMSSSRSGPRRRPRSGVPSGVRTTPPAPLRSCSGIRRSG